MCIALPIVRPSLYRSRRGFTRVGNLTRARAPVDFGPGALCYPGAGVPVNSTAEYAATEQHIRLLQAKRAKLDAALADAERQYAIAVAREFNGDRVGWAELYRTYRVVADGGLAGYLKRWQEAIPYSPQRMCTNSRIDPTGEQEWSGCGMEVWRENDRPPTGVSVVYVLFSEDATVVYVGSTRAFTKRMSQHRRSGKMWATWQAFRCRDREHAYEIESRFLDQHMPSGNRCGGRRTA